MAEQLDTNKQTHTEKVDRGTLPSYAIRYGEAFFPWKTKKKRLGAARFARLVTNLKIKPGQYQVPGSLHRLLPRSHHPKTYQMKHKKCYGFGGCSQIYCKSSKSRGFAPRRVVALACVRVRVSVRVIGLGLGLRLHVMSKM